MYSMLIFININLYNYSCDYLYSFCIVSVSFIVCSFVCCVSFDCGVILCDVWYLFVVSYCKPLPPGKNPFAVNEYYITLHYIILARCMDILSHILLYTVEMCVQLLWILFN
jgi:hypothetical protein